MRSKTFLNKQKKKFKKNTEIQTSGWLQERERESKKQKKVYITPSLIKNETKPKTGRMQNNKNCHTTTRAKFRQKFLFLPPPSPSRQQKFFSSEKLFSLSPLSNGKQQAAIMGKNCIKNKILAHSLHLYLLHLQSQSSTPSTQTKKISTKNYKNRMMLEILFFLSKKKNGGKF